jgi:hypothetical protein
MSDPEDFLAQEQADRELERSDSPRLWLGPTKAASTAATRCAKSSPDVGFARARNGAAAA